MYVIGIETAQPRSSWFEQNSEDYDQRTGPQYQTVIDRIGEEKMLSVVASIGGLYFTLCKLLWVGDNEPRNYKYCPTFSNLTKSRERSLLGAKG